MLIEAYIDESGTGENDLVHCLAGYVLKPNRGMEMARRWKVVLDRYNLPYFHMTDCAAYQHCEPYKSLGKAKCVALATELIKLIKKHCLHGFAVCFSPAHYIVYEDPNFIGLDQYSYSVKIVLDQVRSLSRDIEEEASVSYFFEAGHRNQRKAREVLDVLLDEAEKRSCPFSYSFMRKQDSVLLQAADILAWHCNTYIKRTMNGHPLRKDFESLLEIPHQILHFSSHLRERDVSPSVTRIMFDRWPGRSDEAAAEIRKIYRDGV